VVIAWKQDTGNSPTTDGRRSIKSCFHDPMVVCKRQAHNCLLYTVSLKVTQVYENMAGEL
jgi:hypothetical protein